MKNRRPYSSELLADLESRLIHHSADPVFCKAMRESAMKGLLVEYDPSKMPNETVVPNFDYEEGTTEEIVEHLQASGMWSGPPWTGPKGPRYTTKSLAERVGDEGLGIMSQMLDSACTSRALLPHELDFIQHVGKLDGVASDENAPLRTAARQIAEKYLKYLDAKVSSLVP
jgi:hypothetical protein